jgi:hypothetical protein
MDLKSAENIDREKVIREYEDYVNSYISLTTSHDYEFEMHKAVLALLKEQEAVKPVLDEQTGRIWLCGNCGSYVGFEDNDPHDPNEFDKYCRECGRPVLWEGR